ncbi:MAG: YbaB/EbfC family nucleoid-associated protein [Clostridia bacterium]|nr:YbaB/EbfC family nucleoid-associated protein [Clostridia bacterium]
MNKPFMGGMPNMQQMLKQAQQLQNDIAVAEENLKNAIVTASAGGGMVNVKMSGTKKLIEIKLNKQAVDPSDVNMLEDLITAAMTEAYNKAEELYQKTMGPLTGGKLGLGI